MSAQPYQSLFAWAQSGQQSLYQTFDKMSKGIVGVREQLTKAAKIQPLPSVVAGDPKDQEQAQKAISAVEKRMMELGDVLQEQKAQHAQFIRDLAATTSPQYLDNLIEALDESQERIVSNQQEFDKLQDIIAQTKPPEALPSGPGMGAGSQFAQGIGGIAQPLGMLGGSLGDLSNTASDVLNQFGMLGSQFEQLSMLAAESGGAFSGPLAGGLSTAANLVGPVAAGLVGLQVGFTLFDDMMGRSTKAINDAIAARRHEMELEEQRVDLLAHGSSEAMTEEIKGLEESIAIRKKARDDQVANAVAETSSVDQFRTAFEAGLNIIVGRGTELTTVYGAAADAARDYNQELGNEADRLQLLQDTMEEVRAREAAEELEQARIKIVENLATMGSVLDDVTDQIADFNEQAAFARSRELEDRRIADERAESDHQEQLTSIADDGRDRRVEIEADAQKQVGEAWESFEKERVKSVENLAKQLSRIDEDEQKSIDKTNAQYMKDRVEAQKQHLKTIEKAQSDYEKQRLRREEDALAAMIDAEMANDVIRFIQAEQQRDLDLKRMREDHQEQQTETETQFQEEQTARRQQREEAIAYIKAGAEEQREALRESSAEEARLREEALAERLADIQENYDTQMAEQKKREAEQRTQLQDEFDKRRALEDEDRRLRDQRQAEDDARQIEQMRAAAQDRLDELEDQQQQLRQVEESGGKLRLVEVQQWEEKMRAEQVASYQNAMNQLRSLASSATSYSGGSDLRAAGYGSSQTAASYSANRFGGRAIFAQHGVLTTRPTLAVMSENYQPELVLPVSQSAGLPPELLKALGGGKGDLHFHAPIDLGNISEDVFRDEMGNLRDALYQFLEESA